LQDKNVSNTQGKKYTRKNSDFLKQSKLLMLLHKITDVTAQNKENRNKGTAQ